MATLIRRKRTQETNIWPGFVDALAALLMVIIFVLMIFIVAQFYLTQLLSGRDDDLAKLQGQILELGELLSVQRTTNNKLENSIELLNERLVTAATEKDTLNSKLSELIVINEDLDAKSSALMHQNDVLEQDLKNSNLSINLHKSDLEDSTHTIERYSD